MIIAKSVLVLLELVAFGSFTWAATSFFMLDRKGPKDWRISFIKYAGTVFIIGNIYYAATISFHIDSAFILGCIVLSLSVIIFWSSIYANRKSHLQFAFSGINSNQVVRVGVYSYIRHPFYLSYSLGWLGGPIALKQWELLIPFLAMGYIYLTAAKAEEKHFLNSDLKEIYKKYQTTAGMFFPKIFRRLM